MERHKKGLKKKKLQNFLFEGKGGKKREKSGPKGVFSDVEIGRKKIEESLK